MTDTNKYEEYQNARVEGFIPAEWEFEDYLLAEVKRLRETAKTVHNLKLWEEAEVKRLRRQIKVAQGVFEHLYDDELEDASWIRWFCNMEDEEE